MILISATLYRLLFLLTSVSVIFISENIQAECRDFDAIAAGNKKASSYYKDGEVFHPGVIHKIHHPSRKKEVASYIKVGTKRYSIFTLVDDDCKVEFRKRTRQTD